MRKVLFVGAALVAALGIDAAKAEIGVLAAVNRDMTGARPTEQARPIFIKEKLVQDERIVSTVGGGGQVLFLDQTSLTIAPNSEVVLDKYVYDPATESGEMTVTVLKGAMRFVGGRISKTEPAIIRTPTATIGIRGGMGNINVQDGADTLYMHVAGFSSTITSGDQELTITREGGLASIGANGDLQYLGVADSDFIGNAFRPEAAGQGGGGSLNANATSTVNEATGQVAEIVSGEPDAVTQAAISTVGEKQSIEFGELAVDVDIDLGTEFASATQMMDEAINPINPAEIGSFLATGLFATTVVSEGISSADPNAVFQLIYNGVANEGAVFFSIPETGDQLTAINGDQFSGMGDQFLVRLGADGQFSGNTGLATVLQGNPSNSAFTLTEGPASSTLDGNVSVNYENSTLVQFLQAVDGNFTDAQIQFIESFIEPGVDLATLQAELDRGLADFKQILRPLP